VLHELSGVEERVARWVGLERPELLLPGRMGKIDYAVVVDVGKLGGVADELLGALALDGDDALRTERDEVEVWRLPADTDRAFASNSMVSKLRLPPRTSSVSCPIQTAKALTASAAEE
jgi:hypothetical protein